MTKHERRFGDLSPSVINRDRVPPPGISRTHRRQRSWLLSVAGHPGPNVRRTVAKHDAVCFARSQETNGVAVHENQVLEVQHASRATLVCGEQRGQFADVAVFRAMDFQHRSSLYVSNRKASTKR